MTEEIMRSFSELAAYDAWRCFKPGRKSRRGPAEVQGGALLDAVGVTYWLATEPTVCGYWNY